MKKILVKIRKSTFIKLLMSLLVPGGVVLWALYEFKEYKRKKERTLP